VLKTLDQSLKILLCFTREKPSWGARELAKEVGLNHANVYRILSTFEANRFLVKDPETKKYSLGIRLWELGIHMFDTLHVGTLIRPIMKRLMEETGESIFLTSLDDNQGLTLDVMEPDNVVKFSVSVGSRAPLYVGASYRTILAYLPEETVEQIIRQGLKKYTATTLTDPELLRKDLAEIRAKGWGRSEGEYTPDVIAIAVPLFSHAGNVMGSLAVSGPIYRMSEEKIERSLKLLQQAKREIDEIVGKYRLDLSRYLIGR
jgi:DNA-binding IclR family transcriptional regulator